MISTISFCQNARPSILQVALLHAIRSPSKPLRHVVGTNVAVIVGVGGLPTWPELLMSFVQCLESSDPNALEGALDALYKVCIASWHLCSASGVLDSPRLTWLIRMRPKLLLAARKHPGGLG